MLPSSSKGAKSNVAIVGATLKPIRSWRMAIVLPAWVVSGFFVAQLLVAGLFWGLEALRLPIVHASSTVLVAIMAALIYLVTLGLVIGLPWLLKQRRIGLRDIGLHRLPSWMDIWMAPAGLILYLILSAGLIYLATTFLPQFDVGQAQDTGFGHLSQRYEYILAFVTLVVVAPVAEEVLFRGYLFGKLKKFVPIWLAILVTSLLFGAVHGAWNVAIDTFALSLVLCLLRLSTGSLWASILLHMTKNGIAYYILFINPAILHTLGG
ncbi:MAG: CPBP family intramembrane glutamic endopeptidase [Candidatus Saccharibacteria bacterium]